MRYTISSALSKIIGATHISTRPEALKKFWIYIKANNLQNPDNRREILADDNLGAVFGKKSAMMTEIFKIMGKHVTKIEGVDVEKIKTQRAKKVKSDIALDDSEKTKRPKEKSPK